ncbi:unnamed protein product [Amoebophrya sp. A120]|nr:unnamed protein product [Amoebophrya sp. A120]|eukprot:GSA120T00018794001.1
MSIINDIYGLFHPGAPGTTWVDRVHAFGENWVCGMIRPKKKRNPGEIDPEAPVVINLHDAIPTGQYPLSNSKKIKLWVAQDPERHVYIGRPSIWGNPFRIGDHGDSRETVVRKYREYLVNDHPEVLVHLGDLRGKILGCWCHPHPCHGHVLQNLYRDRDDARFCRACTDQPRC